MDYLPWIAVAVIVYLLFSNGIALTTIQKQLLFSTERQHDLLTELQALHGTVQGIASDLDDLKYRAKEQFPTEAEALKRAQEQVWR